MGSMKQSPKNKPSKVPQKSKQTTVIQGELIPRQVSRQIDNMIVQVSIRELCEQRERFNLEPAYQREDCWTLRQEQQLIDTILSGLGIGLFEGYKYLSCWELLDGHNRMKTILNFYDGKFKTWTDHVKKTTQPISKFGAAEAGKRFNKFSLEHRETFLDYHLPISKIPEMTVAERASRFITLQCQTSLTPAERMHVYPSKANTIAARIAEHPFWADFFFGEANRKRVFLSSLYLLALQMAPDGITDLRSPSPYLTSLASGQYDDKITDSVLDAVQERLDSISCVYAGMTFTDRAAIIPMYQSIMILEQAGCTIQSSTHKGVLKDWMSLVINESKQASSLAVYHRPIHHLHYASMQRAFWDRNREKIKVLCGVNTQENDAA